MKKIVVPVDFSENSVIALKKAIRIAYKMVAEISMLYVIKDKALLSFLNNSDENIHDKDIENSFEQLMKSVAQMGVPMEYHIRKGRVPHEITNFARKSNAYMIVMGTHGATGFEKFWAGSNAYRVVSSADCPVLTMRGNEDFINIKKIVLPIDTTETTRQKVPFVIDLATYFSAEVHVIAVCTDEGEEFVTKLTSYTAQVCRFLNKHKVYNINEFIKGDNPTTMTIEYAKKVEADLICIMTDQETSIMNTFLGPYAQQMVHQSPIPVLSMQRNLDLEGDFSIM